MHFFNACVNVFKSRNRAKRNLTSHRRTDLFFSRLVPRALLVLTTSLCLITLGPLSALRLLFPPGLLWLGRFAAARLGRSLGRFLSGCFRLVISCTVWPSAVHARPAGPARPFAFKGRATVFGPLNFDFGSAFAIRSYVFSSSFLLDANVFYVEFSCI